MPLALLLEAGGILLASAHDDVTPPHDHAREPGSEQRRDEPQSEHTTTRK